MILQTMTKHIVFSVEMVFWKALNSVMKVQETQMIRMPYVAQIAHRNAAETASQTPEKNVTMEMMMMLTDVLQHVTSLSVRMVKIMIRMV